MLTAFTAAPGTAAPCGSSTVPLTDAVCACTTAGTTSTRMSATIKSRKIHTGRPAFFICFPLNYLSTRPPEQCAGIYRRDVRRRYAANRLPLDNTNGNEMQGLEHPDNLNDQED